jgi:hypothetical protein
MLVHLAQFSQKIDVGSSGNPVNASAVDRVGAVGQGGGDAANE